MGRLVERVSHVRTVKYTDTTPYREYIILSISLVAFSACLVLGIFMTIVEDMSIVSMYMSICI